MEENKLMTVVIHIQERDDSEDRGSRYRRFDCWAEGEGTELLDAMAVTNYKKPFSKRLEAVDADDVQKFAGSAERLAWRWNLAAKENNVEQIKVERALELKF